MSTPAQKLSALRDAGDLTLSGKQWGGRGRSVATLGGRSFTYTGRRISKPLGSAIDQAFARGASPGQQLATLRASGELNLSGKHFGGSGRSYATLGGRRFAYAGGPILKSLATAVGRAYTPPGQEPLIIGDLVGDDGDDNTKPSRESRVSRREGLTKIQRAVRAKITEPAKRSRNEYVHRLVEGLKAMNRGAVDKLLIDLKNIKARALRQLIVNNVVSDKRLALKLPNGRHYFLNDRTLQRLADGLIDGNAVGPTTASDEELVALSSITETVELVSVPAGRKRPAGAFFKYTHKTGLDFSRYGIFAEVKSETTSTAASAWPSKPAASPRPSLSSSSSLW